MRYIHYDVVVYPQAFISKVSLNGYEAEHVLHLHLITAVFPSYIDCDEMGDFPITEQ